MNEIETVNVEQSAAGAGICLGYIRLDRLGDLDVVECAECGQDAAEVYAAVMIDDAGRLALWGPLCEICAETSE